MSSLLKVRELGVHFGGSVASNSSAVPILDGVDFHLERGEALALVGESGSGKSTTVSALIGQLPRGMQQVAGEIHFDGRNLGLLDPKVRRRISGKQIGVVFQEPTRSLNPVLRVGEQIAEVLRYHEGLRARAAWTRAVELLEEVGLERAELRARDYPHQLSGGMNQRVAIAMAIACSPALLIADEPTTALDVTVQKEVLGIFRELRITRGMALLFVTHDLALVRRQVDRVAVMYAGRIVEAGSVATIFDAARHPYTAGLLACQPAYAEPRSRVAEIGGTVPRLGERPSGCAFHPRCSRAQAECSEDLPVLEAAQDARELACFHPLEPGAASGSNSEQPGGGSA